MIILMERTYQNLSHRHQQYWIDVLKAEKLKTLIEYLYQNPYHHYQQ